MEWVAGRPLKIKTPEGRSVVRNVGEPVPEALGWPIRQFQAHKNLGWIVLGDSPKPVKRRRKKVKDVMLKG